MAPILQSLNFRIRQMGVSNFDTQIWYHDGWELFTSGLGEYFPFYQD